MTTRPPDPAITTQLLTDLARLEALVRARLEAKAQDQAVVDRILGDLTPRQRAFVDDLAKMRAALCSRRAGKSHAVIAWMVIGAILREGTASLIVGITRKSIKRVSWTKLKKFSKKYSLGLKFHETDLIATFPNGSTVQLEGCPSLAHADTFRGSDEGYYRVAIEEAASFPQWLHSVIDDVLMPALADQDGELALVGTPGPAPTGPFYEVTRTDGKEEQGWSVHRWLTRDNTAAPHIWERRQQDIKRRGWTLDHPTVRREDLGEWISDLSMLVYSGLNNSALVDSLPALDQSGWHFVLGIDLGTSKDDATTAYSVVAWHERHNVAYVVETEAFSAETPSTIADRVGLYQARYALDTIVMDSGGLGGGYIRELQTKYSLGIIPAEKENKRGYLEMLNGDLVIGRLKLLKEPNQSLLGQMRVLPWEDEKRLKEREGVPNHCCDACLYSWRHALHYFAAKPAENLNAKTFQEQREEQHMRAFEMERKEKRKWWKRVR